MTGYFYLKALAAAGRYEDEYRMLVNGSEHGWVNMLREGATACWEAWGKDQPSLAGVIIVPQSVPA